MVNGQCQDLYTIATVDGFEGVMVNTRLRIGHTIAPGITIASGYLVWYLNTTVDSQVEHHGTITAMNGL